MEGTEMDITEWPTNIHEYHRMMATAQANMMKLTELEKAAKEAPEAKVEEKKEKE